MFAPDGRFVYLLNELDASVDALAFDAERGTLAPVQSLFFGGFGDELVALAAGTRDTTAPRHDACGASTPVRRSNG